MAPACEIERQNVISANDVDATKTAGTEVVIPDRNVLPHNVTQTNLSLFLRIFSKRHANDLNMDFVA